MRRLIFTRQPARFTRLAQVDTGGATLRAGRETAVAASPLLRSYVLDAQGHPRENVVVFIDGHRCHERVLLGEALNGDSQVDILQALCGG